MPDDRCPDCGGLYTLIGRRHLCRGAPVTKAAVDAAIVDAERQAAEINRLTTEVKQLKRQLATNSVASTVVSTECPMCKARREAKAKAMRKWRRGGSPATAMAPSQ